VIPAINYAVTGSQRPTYPSSKPKRVDWDKLEAEVKKEVCLDLFYFGLKYTFVPEIDIHKVPNLSLNDLKRSNMVFSSN
jgi:hypothetical protein